MSFSHCIKQSGATSTIASRISTVPDALYKTIVFGTEWHFKPEGLESLRQKFQEELDIKHLAGRFEYNLDLDIFFLYCQHESSYEVWETLFKVAQELIAQEFGDGVELNDEASGSEAGSESSDETDEDYEFRPIKSNKIQRIAIPKKKNVIAETVNESGDDEASDSCQRMHGLDHPVEIRYHKSKAIWKYHITNPILDEIVSDELLKKLAYIIGCEFVKDVNQGNIHIGAESEEQCHQAMCKLDIIRKNLDSRFVYVKHIFYSEEHERYEVSLRPFIDVKKKFFETTLLDNLQLTSAGIDYKNLAEAITVRCAIFDRIKSRFIPFRVGKYRAAVNLDKKDSGSREWKDFTYGFCIPQGNEHNNAMTRFEKYTEEPCSTQQPEQPVFEVMKSPKPIFEDAGLPSEYPQDHVEGIQRWNDEVHNPSLQISASDDDAVQSGNSDQQHKEQSWETYLPYNGEDCLKIKQKKGISQNSGLQSIASASPKRDSASLAQVPRVQLSEGVPQPIETHASSHFTTLENKIIQNFHQASPTIIQSTPSQTVSCFLDPDSEAAVSPAAFKSNSVIAIDESIAHLNFEHFPVLEPTRNIPAPDSPPETSALCNDPFGSPVRDLPSYRAPKYKSRQAIDEVATRKFCLTMNQKAPKPNAAKKSLGQNSSKSFSTAGRLEVPEPLRVRKPLPADVVPINDPTSEFINAFDSGFDELVKDLRGFQGEITVEIEFGRLMLKQIAPKYITRGDSKSSLDHHNAQHILENADGTQMTLFTKVLTAIPAEISYLVEMQDSQGRLIWEQNQSSWDVFYKILFVDESTGIRRPFIIEIDAERLTRDPRVKVRRDFGSINVHGIKRHWDFRVTATGMEANENIDSSYRELANALKRSLYVPRGLRSPMIFFEVSDAFSQFIIFGIRVYRVNQYRSLDTKSTLKVAEVRELKVEIAQGDGCSIYKGVEIQDPSSWDADFGFQYLHLWHEVSIYCPAAEKLFEQNKILELGEEASWTPAKLSQINAASSLYLPACEMIKQMDGIGFYNDNKIDVEAASLVAAEPKIERPYFFW